MQVTGILAPGQVATPPVSERDGDRRFSTSKKLVPCP